MTNQDESQFDARDEAFFNAYDDDAPLSERPVTFELEAAPHPRDDEAEGPAAREWLARRTRLTRVVAETVAALALFAGSALVVHLVRGASSLTPRPPAVAEAAARHAPPPTEPEVTVAEVDAADSGKLECGGTEPAPAAPNAAQTLMLESVSASSVEVGELHGIPAAPDETSRNSRPVTAEEANVHGRRRFDALRARPAVSDASTARLLNALRRYRPVGPG